MILTYQTRLSLDADQESLLQQYAVLLSSVERALYAEVAKGKTPASCKNSFLKKYGITARQFNACRVNLEGKIASCRSSQERAIFSLKEQIKLLESKIEQLNNKPSKLLLLHKKKRRAHILAHRLASLEADKKQGRIHLCFGGKKLFRAQFHLRESGYVSHQDWKKAWNATRCSEFFVLGSKDETAGNQTCTARILENGQLALRLRLPDALKRGKYFEITGLIFSYGHEAIVASLNSHQAISYRFKKDEKGWRVFVSTALSEPKIISQEGRGVIGIDLNVDHIAYTETDRFGNPIESKTFSWICYGKSRSQLKAITGDLCKEIVDKAKKAQKPLIIEQLDFQKKKLSESTDRASRMLSGFAYGQFFTFLMARAFKQGITTHRVNPAFTSLIGRINYAKRYGLSIHLAAALCIARRYQQFSESPSFLQGTIPDGKGGHVAFALPERNRTKHVWHFWKEVRRKMKTVLAAHFLAIRDRSLSPLSTLEMGDPLKVIGAIPIRKSSAALLG